MHRAALTSSTATAVLAAVMITSAVVLATTASFFTAVGAQTASNDTNVTLSVAEETSVTVTPTLFNFSGMTLGETNFTDIQALRIQIENTGSTNLTNIRANPDTISSEQDNPLGTGQPGEYAAGRFLWITNTSANDFGFYQAGHLTWNLTEQAGGEPSGVTGRDTGSVSIGYYRNATAEYLWEMVQDTTGGSSGFCNSTSAYMEIKTNADTGSNRDLDTSVTQYTVQTGNNNWGLAGSTAPGVGVEPVAAGPLQGHYVALSSDCTKAYTFRYDIPSGIPSPNGGAGTTSTPYLVGNSTQDHITPGETWTARVGAAVHSGVPDGDTNRTLLTITASAQ